MELKAAREEKGYTQEQLAKAVGRERSLIAKIESGTAYPSVGTAKALASVLGIDWTLFFTNVGE